jgi:hypothetical protein
MKRIAGRASLRLNLPSGRDGTGLMTAALAVMAGSGIEVPWSVPSRRAENSRIE